MMAAFKWPPDPPVGLAQGKAPSTPRRRRRLPGLLGCRDPLGCSPRPPRCRPGGPEGRGRGRRGWRAECGEASPPRRSPPWSPVGAVNRSRTRGTDNRAYPGA